MIRNKSSVFCKLTSFLFASLIIVLPFIHLHPQLTHSVNSEQHTHAGVIHTIFSPDGMGYPTSSQDSIHPEISGEFSRVTIGWNLFPQRYSSEPALGGEDTPSFLLSSVCLLSVKDIALQRGKALLRPLSWESTPSSSRAPPRSFPV